MKHGFIKSSPYFFRIISASSLILISCIAIAALLFPAPLHPPANPSVTPNPSKSAWFLLWIQEAVSWSNLMIYPVAILLLSAAALPWLAPPPRRQVAIWFSRHHLPVNIAAIALLILVITLTVIAAFFRGENWRLLH